MMARMIALMALALLGTAACMAAPAPVPPGQRLAATCAGCHGSNGLTVGNALPSLAGQESAVLLASLRAFRDGTRPSTIMRQIANGYSDEQMIQIAAYFSAQKGPR